MNKIISESINKVRANLEAEKFKGYDPYDTLNSFIPFEKMGKWIPILALQFQKRNPINIRPLLGIKKGINPKGMGLLLRAYTILSQTDKNSPEVQAKMEEIFNWLVDNPSKGYSGYCWGYNFAWASKDKFLKPYVPNIVATSFVAKGMFEYYEQTKNQKAKEVIISITDFLLNDLPTTENELGFCISYTPIKQDACFNATLLGAEVLAKAYYLSGNELYKKRAVQIMDFVISYQKPAGEWNYNVDLQTGKEQKQIDFHQGYNVETIYMICKYLGLADEKYTNSIKKGLEFYRREQFFESGQSLWRIPRVYPVEIHNQSQGVITFTLLKEFNKEYFSFANTIAEWTIKNMQHPKGYFYNRKNKYYDIKIPYVRWSNSWMFLALAILHRENFKQKA